MQVPHIFSPGFPSKANEVNENFAALAAAITDLEARVAAVEGAAPIPGKYFLMGYQTGLIPGGPGGAVIEGIVYTGNLTLGDGTTSGNVSAAITESKNELHISPSGSGRQFVQTPETIEGSWNTTSGAALALVMPSDPGQPPRTLRFARGAGRLFIGNHMNAGDGSSVMLFLIRTGNL